ncbi:fimbrial protein [Pseudaeromonas sp. ZJS20]|uniref:fimbrial protein n=1 Tax=Pseudaeromonas aegiceratis TaxID=3153928 RepID=UPI00390C582E
MNAQLISRALLAAALLSGTAQATDGTINFTGTLTSSTCTVSVNGGSDVTLPTLSTDALTDAGSWAGRTPFTVDLSSCSMEDSLTTVGLYFETTSEIDSSNGTLNNSGTASNVQVRLRNADYDVLDLTGGDMDSQNSLAATPDGSGNASIDFFAEYYSEAGSAGAGTVTAQAVFSLNYQ